MQRKPTVSSAVRIGSVCFLSYMFCYLAKNLLSAMMPQLLESGLFDDRTLGRMASVFMLCYGMGQLINGAIGNVVRGRYMIPLGLLAPGLLLMIFPNCSTPWLGVLLWGMCGFFCSMLWGPIARVIGENTTPAAGQLLVTLMTVASTVGSLATQALAVVGGITDAVSTVFYLCGGMMCLVAAGAFVYLWHLERHGVIRTKKNTPTEKPDTKRVQKASAGFAILTPCFLFMTLVTMVNGIVRNAVSFWIPTFLAQYLAYSAEVAAGLVMLLPLFNVLGMFLTMWVFRRVRCNEKTMCAFCFLICIPLFSMLFFLRGAWAPASAVSLFLASGVMMGVCNLVFSVYILRFTDTGLLSGISGFFDFASYMSASAASFVFSDLMAGGNWSGLIAFWVTIAAIGTVLSVLARVTEKKELTNAGESDIINEET